MNRLDKIERVVNRGYLLVSQYSVISLQTIIRNLRDLTASIRRFRNPEEIEQEFERIKQEIEFLVRSEDDSVFSRVIDNIKMEYNDSLALYKAQKEFKCDRMDLKQNYSQSSYFERLSLIDRYHRLLGSRDKEFSSEKSQNDIFSDMNDYFMRAGGADGARILQESKGIVELGGGIRVKTVLALVWDEIRKLPESDRNAAKTQLVGVLTPITSVKYNDISIYLLDVLRCLNVRHSVDDIADKFDLERVLHNHFQAELKKEIKSLSANEQATFLESLVARDLKKQDFNGKFSSTVKEKLEKELAGYDLIPGVEVQDQIDKQLKVYFEEKAHHHLLAIFKEELKRADRDLLDRMELLKACLAAELQEEEHPQRKAALKLLQTEAKKAKEKEAVDALCANYLKMQEVDAYFREVKKIQSNRNQSPAHATALRPLDPHIQRSNTSIFQFYIGMKPLNSNENKLGKPSTGDHHLSVLRSENKRLADGIEKFEVDAERIYRNKVYPSAYVDIVTAESGDALKKVSAIFKEYVSGIWKFHWGRTHTAEANEVASGIDRLVADDKKNDIKKIGDAKELIMDVLKRLSLEGHLNLEGSFMRRSSYCLDYLTKNTPNELHISQDQIPENHR